MRNKILIIGIAFLAALTGQSADAQNSFNLPYSQYGLGSVEQPFNMPMASAMGGVVYTRSNSNAINPFNPASYGGIGLESFVFDMGLNVQMNRLTSDGRTVKSADGNVGYLAVGLPITRWWKMAAGLMPYSSVSYVTRIPATTGGMATQFEGRGGVNQIFAGMAFNVLDGKKDKLQAGFNVKYLTGSVVRLMSYTTTDTSLHLINSRHAQELRLSNVLLDFGVQYRRALGEKYTLGAGVVYKPYMDMRVKEVSLIYTYHATSEALLDTVFPASGEDAELRSRLEQTHTVGVGVNLERNGLWQVAADAAFSGWQGLRHTPVAGRSVFGESPMRGGAYSRYAVGFEKLVNAEASNYFGRMGWSAGASMEQGLLYLTMPNGESRVDRWSIGAGATLPMRRGRSLLTISVGYSSMGDKAVMQRRCVTFGVAVSSCERWFVKRKYN